MLDDRFKAILIVDHWDSSQTRGILRHYT